MATRFVWLAQRPYGTDRGRRRGGERQRPRLALPDAPALQDRLPAAFRSARCRATYASCTAGNCQLVGLLRLEVPCDSVWKGPTTFWSEEAQFLREYLERPQDCYVVHVTEAFRFTLPLSRDHMLTVANANAKLKWAADGGIAHCTDLNAQALSLHSGSLAGDRLVPACCNVEEACRRWDLPLHELANLRTNVQPEPIAQLVLEGRWGDLVWRASWKSPFATPLAHLDLPALRRRNQCQPADPRSGAACGYAEVHALLRDLQRWERCCCCCCHCCNNSSSNNNKGGRRRFCKQLRWCTWRSRPIGCRDIVRLCHSLTGCSGPLRRQARPQTHLSSPHISLQHNYAT